MVWIISCILDSATLMVMVYFQLMHCLACFISSYVIIIFCSMRCEIYYRFFDDSSSSFFSSDNRPMLVGYWHNALSSEMSAGAGRGIVAK